MGIEHLVKEPYVRVLCYPSPDAKIAIERVDELKVLKVKDILFEGKTKIGKLGVVGKGCVSVVVKATTNSDIYAVKIRRMDANRVSMKREAEMHLMANSINVGPKLFGVTENFLLMEFIEGSSILEWSKGIEKQRIEKIRKVLEDLLDQCYALDRLGLDHGELSDVKKHVIISEKPVIIDFESASIGRRAANLTKIVQYLFIGGPMSKNLRKILGIEDQNIVVDSVRKYKEEKNQESYLNLLSRLNLVS